jgi:hypothetical protein
VTFALAVVVWLTEAADADAVSALVASRRIVSVSGAAVAFASSASERCAAIVMFGCPVSPIATPDATPAISPNALKRVAALSAFVPGGPVPDGWSACVNAAVRCCAAACVLMPSCAATEVASELANCAMTSSSEVPRSSCALTAATSALSGVASELVLGVAVAVEAAGCVAFVCAAAIESVRTAWNKPPPPSDFEFAGGVVPGWAGPIFGVGTVRMGVRVSPPSVQRSRDVRGRTPPWVYRSVAEPT